MRGGKGQGSISSGAIIGAIIAATALLGLGFAALLAVRRQPVQGRDDRLVQAVDEMRTRMDDLGRDLSDALERAERESKRNRFLSDLGSSVEFEELLDRVLDAALEVPGFDAAMVVLDDGGGASSLATRGMTPDEAAHPPSSGAAGTMPAGPITVNYRYGSADAADTQLIRGGLFLSLVARDGELARQASPSSGAAQATSRPPSGSTRSSRSRRRAFPRSRTPGAIARHDSWPRPTR